MATEIAATASPVAGPSSSSQSVGFVGVDKDGSLSQDASNPASVVQSDDDAAKGEVRATPKPSKSSSKRRLLRHGPVKVVANDPMPAKCKPTPKTLSAPEMALADKPPIFIRRSSREQGGLGRDLEGEVVRAMEDGQDGPSLGISMEEPLDEHDHDHDHDQTDKQSQVSQDDTASIHVRT